ncbi:MAG TPA: glycosyltransferase family 4 protein [Bacteroidales bacterium]|nr:glycosyltransferase family 4 protein [Bacteroidales bacterium]
MSYVIIGDLFTFPEGEAATNRVHTYAKGFVANGKRIHIICFGNVYTHFKNGEFNRINYYHPFGQTARSNYFVVRTWKKIMKFVRATRLVINLNRQEKIRAIIVYTALPLTFLFSWFLSALTGSKLIQEISEHPLRNYQKGKFSRKFGVVKLRTETALADGIFCISHFLIDFYKARGVQQHRLFLVPSTVDPQRFNLNTERPLDFPYIGYFGMLSFNRDNIDNLIHAFARIAPKYPNLRLVLGGPQYHNQRMEVLKLSEGLGLSNRLILLDFLPREEVVKYIVNSEILVMVRADDVKTKASFPSKLTEYLASGRPVITVNVGEIAQYLVDGINAYIVEPGNRDKLAEKIDQVLTSYDRAIETGKRGKLLTESIFNYNYQAKRMIPFIDSLYKA